MRVYKRKTFKKKNFFFKFYINYNLIWIYKRIKNSFNILLNRKFFKKLSIICGTLLYQVISIIIY